MGGFDGNGDGVVDMHIDATAQAVGGLRAHAGTLESGWNGVLADIAACSGKLGKGGDLSDMFMASYGPWRAELERAVTDLPRMYREVADKGDEAVVTYQTAEQESADGFRS